ncbi:MAG: arylsulfatase [Verrucomicrobiae bacterium]|nr:arylsulfatase [Verrucomicrobiae bacterium]
METFQKIGVYWRSFAVVFLGLIGDATVSNLRAADHPNILVILSDDQGWGDLSLNGNTNLSTPNIDGLARDGVAFDRFYVCPVCSPTRAEFLTGRYHPRSGVYSTSAGGERMDLDEQTIAEVFRKAGYATAAFGKWHNGMQYPYHPNGRGFDEFYGFCSGHWGDYFSPLLEHNGELVTGEGFIIDDLTNHAMSFMADQKAAGKPFFVYLPLNTPHSPMQVPDEFWERFENKELELRNRDPEKEDIGHTRAALAMCENIDWNVGRLVAKLEELGIVDDTVVLYFSDNGPNGWRWNGGMKGRKGATDEGGVRSPLIVRWPGKVPAGKKIPQISGAIDLLPTLAEVAGISLESPKPLDGVSLVPLLTDPEGAGADWPNRMIFSHWKNRVSVRTQRFRLDHQGKLFDIPADPGQDKDVAAEHPDITNTLKEAVADWEKKVLAGYDQDDRPFVIGHPDVPWTQIPARDGIAHGTIERSNKFPNCSYFRNWTSVDDSITWDVEVGESGDYEVGIWYACPAADVGSTIELSLGENRLQGKIKEAHDPPLRGMEHDRIQRDESYIKDFQPMTLGTIHLDKGPGTLTLKAIEKPGAEVMEFRLMMLRRVE